MREALHSLEQERLVKAIPRAGYVVTRIQKEEVEEICEIGVASDEAQGMQKDDDNMKQERP